MTTPAQATERLVRASVRLSDSQLARPYAWKEYEEGIRFALLMAHHELRDLAAMIAHERAVGGPQLTLAHRLLGQYHEAYRDLTGALAPLSDAEIDAVPSPGQWPVRATVGHMLGAESGFRTSMVLAVRHRRAGVEREATDEEIDELNVPETAGVGRKGVLDALYRSHTRVLGELLDVTDDETATPSQFWEVTRYPVTFRMRRLEEHLRQHTIQIDKAVIEIGHVTTEAERLVRLLHRALGDVEAAALGASDIAAAAQERSAAFIESLARDVEAAF